MADELIYTVTQLNKYVHEQLESDPNLRMIFLVGEISNCVCHRSGHIYMTIKDEKATVKAVMFQFAASRLDFVPKSGMQIKALGRVSLYERDGAYQFYIEHMTENGSGNLFAQFEKLKQELNEAGMFDEAVKKPIPRFPQKIGVITSPTGAAIQDIRNILSRRYKLADILLYGVHVQGDGAANEMVEGIRYLNNHDLCDVIIIGRGGGSMEDLWEFNSKELAYAIFESNIPVISAVGHETDFTICDFVADLRAPTPSAAAELAVPDINEISDYLYDLESKFKGSVNIKLNRLKEHFELIKNNRCFSAPLGIINMKRENVEKYRQKICSSFSDLLNQRKMHLSEVASQINALSPLSTLERGYTVTKNNERIIKRTDDLSVGDKLSVKFFDGYADCLVEKIYNTENSNEE